MTARKGGDDRALVVACLEGDDAAWGKLIDKYKSLIFSVPLRYGAGRDDAADIFQAVCVELFHELPRLRNIDSLRPWLMTVAAHQSYHWKRNQRRKHAREVEGMETDDLPAVLPPEISAELEREQLVREAIACGRAILIRTTGRRSCSSDGTHDVGRERQPW